MTRENVDWACDWVGLCRDHCDSMTFLQYALDALQARLSDEFNVTLWILTLQTGNWQPIALGRSNPLREQSWRSRSQAIQHYTERLRESSHLVVQNLDTRQQDGVLAEREASAVNWLGHWLCGDSNGYMGVLEIGGESPTATEHHRIMALVSSCLVTLNRLTESPVFSLDKFANTPAPQSKSYDALAEEERLRSLGKLVASVTHEINSPLGVAITGVSHFKDALNELNDHFTSGQLTEPLFREFIEEADDVTELLTFNLGRAVNLIGDFKANAVNQSDNKASRFDLRKVLHSTLNSLQPELKRHNIRLITTNFPDCSLISYSGALSQIVTNLVFNSINHAFAGIEDKAIELSVELGRSQNTIQLIYRDNGIGIPEEQQQAVFEPYYTTRRESGGSGLGLSIIKALATTKLKGVFNLTSTMAQGVEFCFSFPVDVSADQ